MKRFQGAKVTTWTRSRDNQVGPDSDVGLKPDGTPYTTYRATPFIVHDAIITSDNTDVTFIVLPYFLGASDNMFNGEVISILNNYTGLGYERIIIDTIVSVGVNVVVTVNINRPSGSIQNTRAIISTIETSEIIYVSKTYGNDSGIYYKKTLQSAIDICSAANLYFVVILDGDVFSEKLDLKGVDVISYVGLSPTIQFPALGFSGTATGLTADTVTALAEFTISGVPYLFASTDSGLWYSLDGKAWTEGPAGLATKSLTGCCVWNGALYVANSTDNSVEVVTSTTAYTTITGVTIGTTAINGGIYDVGSYLYLAVNDDPIVSARYDGSTWTTNVYGEAKTKVIYDATISTTKAIGMYSSGIVSIDLTTWVETASTAIVPIDIIVSSGQILALTTTSVYFLGNILIPQVWTFRSAHGVNTPSTMAVDPRGWLYVFGVDYYVSRDNGISWYTYGTGPDTGLAYAPAIFFRGVGIVALSAGLAYDDQVHIRDSVGSGTINGVYLEGKNNLAQALEMVRINGDTAFNYCDIGNYYRGTYEYTGAPNLQARNCRIHDMNDFAINVASTMRNNHIYNIDNIAVQRLGNDSDLDDCVIERCGYGVIDANAYGAKDSIIYGNAVDFTETTPTNAPTFEDSVVGTVISTAAPTYTTTSRADPLLLTDGDVKDKSGGYLYDSVAIALGAGCYKITRTSSDAYAVNVHLPNVPTGETRTWQVSNFQSNENANGEYAETWDGLKRRIELSWAADQYANNVQLARLLDVYCREDAVYQYGNSDGTNWTPEMSGACTSTGSVTTITATSKAVGKNEYAGYWVKVGTTYHRIVSHPEAALGASLALTLATAPTGTTYSIDYLLVKVDKSTPLEAIQYLTTSKVITGYTLVLREVDSE